MIYIISSAVVLFIMMILVGVLLFIEAKVVIKGSRDVTVNDNTEKSIQTPVGKTLLATLVDNGILLPSACGGKGSCGTCRCTVDEGGGDILPTEQTHLSRKDKFANIRIACQVKVKSDLKVRIPKEIFNIQTYRATVRSNDNVATFIKELVLKLDAGEKLAFTAGAYMQIDIPEFEVSYKDISVADRYRAVWEKFNLLGLHLKAEETVYRAYSLANPPSVNDVLTFTVRIATPPPDQSDAPPGVGSSYLFNLKAGDRVTLTGPYGDFFAKDTEREMCYIGGGAGMAPLRSHILHLLSTEKTDRKITFWYGARSKQEMFYNDEFKDLETRFDNFSFYVAFSDPQPEDNWEGLTGFIHQCAHDRYLSTHPDPTEVEYYLCGPPIMISSVEKMLNDLGVEPEMITYDKFG